MAKRRKSRAPKRKRRFFGRVRKSFRRAKRNPALQETGIVLSGMAYGAIRQKTAGYVEQAMLKLGVPAGQYVDNLGMGLLMILARRNTSGNMRKLATAGLYAESAMLGAELATNLGGSSSGSSDSFYG